MHYGYWPDTLAVRAPNLRQAQQLYTDLLLSHIPPGVSRILDVGCGSGKVAEQLLDKGYSVACVSPPSRLTTRAAERLSGRAVVTQNRYEDYDGPGDIDLILFSESFQYIDMDANFRLSHRLLNPGGYILLCDFFQTDAEGESPLGGGHFLRDFYKAVPADQFTILTDRDITASIAPTMTLINDLTMNVIKPSGEQLLALLEDRYPWVYKLLRWKFQKKIKQKLFRHFEGRRTAENFIKYKSYRLILLQKK